MMYSNKKLISINQTNAKLLLMKGVKSPRKKSLFFNKFCLTSKIFFMFVLLSASVERFFVTHMQDLFKKSGQGWEQ